jgi:hypothetical protein
MVNNAHSNSNNKSTGQTSTAAPQKSRKMFLFLPENGANVLFRRYVGHKNNFVKIGLHGYQKISSKEYLENFFWGVVRVFE